MRENSYSRVTVKDLARELGVSPSTISNAYNRPDQLSEGLRKRVFAAAKRMGYPGPNPLGRGLKRQRSDAVGVLFGNRLSYVFADPAVMQFLGGVSEAVEEAGLGLVMLPGVSPGGSDSDMLASAAIDGILMHSMASDDPLVEAALGRRVPTVIVDQFRVEGVPSVNVDDEGAGRMAAGHLLELGHRRIGVISSRLALDARTGPAEAGRQARATMYPGRKRLEGYAGAVESFGLSWEDVAVYECSENTLDQGKAAAIGLLSTGRPPSAILALGDQLAFGAMEAAEDLGLSLPADLSIVGFDDVPSAELTTPALTTMRQPHTEKGLMAGRRLVDRLRRGTDAGDETGGDLLLPTRLIVRESTARASA